MKLKILVTAGPTQEPLDPVRFISNYSSGTMGYEIAKAAKVRGHQVTLVSGPVNLAAPRGLKTIFIRSSQDLLKQLAKKIKGQDVLIMAAAVCDFQARKKSAAKIKRNGNLTLKFRRTPDILQKLAHFKKNKIFVGFALESKGVLNNALRKLKQKNLDLIVANAANNQHCPFGQNKTTVWFCEPYRAVKKYTSIPKSKVAKHLLDRVEELCYFKQVS